MPTSFSSSKDSSSKDTFTFKVSTKDFLPHEPSFLCTNCIRHIDARLYVPKDFSFLPSVSWHKLTLKNYTIFVINILYGKTESSLNEQTCICLKMIYPILIFLSYKMLSTKNASKKETLSRCPPLGINM